MKKINPKGTSWNELEKELFTPEEIAESDKRVAAINEMIKANAMNHNDPTCTEMYVRGGAEETESEFQQLLKEQLKNSEFKEEWEKIQPELEAIKERLSHGNAKATEMYIRGNKNQA